MMNQYSRNGRQTSLDNARECIKRILEQEPFDADAGLEQLRAQLLKVRVPAKQDTARAGAPDTRRHARQRRAAPTRAASLAAALIVLVALAGLDAARLLPNDSPPAAVRGTSAPRQVPVPTRSTNPVRSTSAGAIRSSTPAKRTVPVAPAPSAPLALTPAPSGPIVVKPGPDALEGPNAGPHCIVVFTSKSEAAPGYVVVRTSVSVIAPNDPNTTLTVRMTPESGPSGTSVVAHTNGLGRSTVGFTATVPSASPITVTVDDSLGTFVTSCQGQSPTPR